MCSRHNMASFAGKAWWWFVDWTESCCLDEWATGTSVSATGWEYWVALSLTQSATTAWGSWFTGAGSVEKSWRNRQPESKRSIQRPTSKSDNGWAPLRLRVLRMWVPEGEPIAQVNWRFQWLWLYGFVHPQSGETYWWILPKVNINLFNRWQTLPNILALARTSKSFWRWISRLAYKFASRGRVIHLEFMLPFSRASVLSMKRSRISYSRRWMTWKRCFSALPYWSSKTWFGACFHWWPSGSVNYGQSTGFDINGILYQILRT